MLSAAGVRSARRYGIKNIQVLGSSSRLVVQDCTEAEENSDARDKFFMRALINRAQPDVSVRGASFSEGGRPGFDASSERKVVVKGDTRLYVLLIQARLLWLLFC